MIRMFVLYSPIPVFLGNEQINVDPANEKWDHVTDEAYIELSDKGELSLYNLGVYVCPMPNHRFGTGGVVVSRKQLKMNFARNDVQSDCPVWRKLTPFLKTASEMKMRPERLSDWQR